uniref:Replication-associated protein n=1 Tax=Cressdnaviricota sp. TaxID=2748378 RepID=A0A8F3E442_9VIRU|nr:MAG: replication-associated protein [Cressdnaviricota sp.]
MRQSRWCGGADISGVRSPTGQVVYIGVGVSCVLCPAIILVFAGHGLTTFGRHVMYFVNSKYVLLTFAQCGDLDEWNVSDHLSALGAECIVAREVHPTTGGVHLHVFVDFGRKFRSRNVRVFDVDGRHPNVVPSRGTPEKGYDYAVKDGDVVAGGLERPRPRGGMSSGAESIRNVAGLCESTTEFLELFDEMDRGTLFKSFTNIRSYADWRFAPEPEPYVPPFGTEFSSGEFDGRDDWLAQSGIGSGGTPLGIRIELGLMLLGQRPKSLILFGPSRTGKTSWARSLGSHVYFERLFSGKEALGGMLDVEYAVFDDCSINHMPGWKSWFGAQATVGVRAMYRDAQYMKWGKPIVWCCNRDPRIDMRVDIENERSHTWFQDDIDWMEANCIFINVLDKLY